MGTRSLDRIALLAAPSEIYSPPDCAPERGGFSDPRQVDVTALTAGDMLDIVAFIHSSQGPQRGRTAVVVTPDAEFGLGRMYEVYAESVVDLRVFRDADLVLVWVREGSKPTPEAP